MMTAGGFWRSANFRGFQSQNRACTLSVWSLSHQHRRAYSLGAPLDSWVLETGNVAAAGMAASLEALLEWAVSFFFRNTEFIRELREVITGILEFDD